MKLIDWLKYSWCSAKESSVLCKRVDDAKRKQSIYSQISINCYAVGGNNTGQKHSKIIVFPLGFREVFSLLPSCLWIHPEQHHRDGRIRKRFLFFRWDSVPLWGLLRVFESFMARKGSTCHILQLPQCMDRVFLYNPQSISTEPKVYLRITV